MNKRELYILGRQKRTEAKLAELAKSKSKTKSKPKKPSKLE